MDTKLLASKIHAEFYEKYTKKNFSYKQKQKVSELKNKFIKELSDSAKAIIEELSMENDFFNLILQDEIIDFTLKYIKKHKIKL